MERREAVPLAWRHTAGQGRGRAWAPEPTLKNESGSGLQGSSYEEPLAQLVEGRGSLPGGRRSCCQLLGPRFSRWLAIQQLFACCCKPQRAPEGRTARNDPQGWDAPDPGKTRGKGAGRVSLEPHPRRGGSRRPVWGPGGVEAVLLLYGEKAHVTEPTWSVGGGLGTAPACGFTTFRFRGGQGSEGLPGTGQGGAESEAASRGAGGCRVRPR